MTELADRLDLQRALQRRPIELDDRHDAVPLRAAEVDHVADVDLHRVRRLTQISAVDETQAVPEHAKEAT